MYMLEVRNCYVHVGKSETVNVHVGGQKLLTNLFLRGCGIYRQKLLISMSDVVPGWKWQQWGGPVVAATSAGWRRAALTQTHPRCY